MSHYEYGEHLFLYGGSQTKHPSQSDADTGLPILMPYSAAAVRKASLFLSLFIE